MTEDWYTDCTKCGETITKTFEAFGERFPAIARIEDKPYCLECAVGEMK